MALTTVSTVDVAEVLSALLSGIDGLRVYSYVPDTVRVPCAVVMQPDIDFADPESAFCAATWVFPVNLVVSRANERQAQKDMSQLLLDIVTALGADVPGVHSIEPLDARPITVTVNGQDQPGYILRVRVRA